MKLKGESEHKLREPSHPTEDLRSSESRAGRIPGVMVRYEGDDEARTSTLNDHENTLVYLGISLRPR